MVQWKRYKNCSAPDGIQKMPASTKIVVNEIHAFSVVGQILLITADAKSINSSENFEKGKLFKLLSTNLITEHRSSGYHTCHLSTH